MKKYGNPLLVLIAGNLFIHLLNTYVHITLIDEAIALCTAIMLFAFGYTLNSYTKVIRKTTWLKKFLVFFIYIALVVWSLGLIDIPVVNVVFDTVGFTKVFFNMLFIYLGFVFAS